MTIETYAGVLSGLIFGFALSHAWDDYKDGDYGRAIVNSLFGMTILGTYYAIRFF